MIGDRSRAAPPAKPTDAEIDALHKAYADELKAAFDLKRRPVPDATLRYLATFLWPTPRIDASHHSTQIDYE